MGLLRKLASIGVLLSASANLAAQGPTASRLTLPVSLELKDIEIVLVRETGGGCIGRCVHYRVTIRGDGAVTYEDFAQPPVLPRAHAVPVDDVVALMNEFVEARFFEIPDRYVGKSFYTRQDERLLLRGTAAADGPSWDLSIRLGGLVKAVHLYLDYPEYLGNLRERVDRIGGPQAWPAK